MTETGSPEREVLLVVHTGRPAARRSAGIVLDHFTTAGVAVRVLHSEAAALNCRGARVVPDDEQAAAGVELVLVIGGDGTLLRAAEIARPAQAPLLGINLGRVGFLAEAERADLTSTVDRVASRSYDVEERMTLDVAIVAGSAAGPTASNWALNDCSVEKASRQRMLDVVVEVDGRPLCRWGCDGVIAATPTGSTAYAFSAGGPVIWPEVAALLVVPISAHALFARPLVVSPGSVVALELAGDLASSPTDAPAEGVLWCDGRRSVDLRAGTRVEIRRGSSPVRLARLHRGSFTDRLVSKFGLPVQGWRGNAERA